MSSCKVLTELFCLSETLVTFFLLLMKCYVMHIRETKKDLLKKVAMITCYPAYAYATFDTFSFKTKFSKYTQNSI